MRPFDDLQREDPNGEDEGPQSAEDSRPLGTVVDSFALLAAGAALLGSLFTSAIFSAVGASDMTVTGSLTVAIGVAAGIYLLILLGGRHRDRQL